MKALVKIAPGPGNMELRDLPEPQAGPGQVLIEISATGICGTDIHIYRGEYGCFPPVVVGHEVAGRIAEIGPSLGSLAASLKIGDRVTTETFFSTCGRCPACRGGRPNLCPDRRSIGTHVNGGFARYVVVPAANIHLIPNDVPDVAAALIEPLACCVHGVLDLATVTAGDVVLISGPGAIGLLCLQVARSAGATTIVCGTASDEGRLQLATRLGADQTVVVGREDLSQVVGDLTGGLGVDIAVEAAGVGPSIEQCLRAVRRGGTLAQMGLFGAPVTVDYDLIPMREIRVVGSFAQVPSAWSRAIKLLADGRVQTDVLVTRLSPLTDWQDAFERFASRQECKIVLRPVD